MTWLTTLTGARDALNDAELQLGDQPVRCALEPKDVQLPGVWLRFDGLAGTTLCGDHEHVLVTAYVAVASGDLERSLGQLEQLLAVVEPHLPPMSAPAHVALALPGAGTPATALRYTHQLIID